MFESFQKKQNGSNLSDTEIDDFALRLRQEIQELRPHLDGDLVQTFVDKVQSDRLTGTVEWLTKFEVIPAAIENYAKRLKISAPISVSDDETLLELDWSRIETSREISQNSVVAVGLARVAIAETGTFVMASVDHTSSLFNFLPLHHLVIVPVSRIRPYLEDIWSEVDPRDHRMVSLITGTSGTADIEGRNVRGAHGPRYLHILMIANA